MTAGGHERAAALRKAFDESFARADPPAPAPVERLLLVRCGDRRALLPSARLAGVVSCPRLVPLPGGPRQLSGLAGVGGAVVSVYDIGAVLGVEPDAPGRMLAIAACDRKIGIAFDEIAALVDVPAEALRVGPTAAPTTVVSVGGKNVCLIDVDSWVAGLRGRATGSEP